MEGLDTTFSTWEYLESLIFLPKIKMCIGKELVEEVAPRRPRKQRLITREFFEPRPRLESLYRNNRRPGRYKSQLDDIISAIMNQNKKNVFEESQTTIGEL